MKVALALVSLLAQATGAQDLSHYRMEPMGWIFMIGSIGMVLTLVVFCYWKVLSKPEQATARMDAPLD